MKNVLIYLLTTLALTSQAFASGFSFRYIGTDNSAPESITTSIQFDGKIFDCLVDTGARFTLAKGSILSANTKVGEVVGGGVSGHERVADLVQSKVTAGDWAQPDGIIGRTDQIPADCLMGNDFFLNREFSIDFKRMTFTDQSSFSGPTYSLQKYQSDRGGHFGFYIQTQSDQIAALFDTGATDTVIDISYVEAHPDGFEFIQEIDVQDGSNSSIKAGLYRMKSLKMGPIEETNLNVYVLSLKYLQTKIPGIQAVIGLRQMMKYRWYLNTNKLVWGIW